MSRRPWHTKKFTFSAFSVDQSVDLSVMKSILQIDLPFFSLAVIYSAMCRIYMNVLYLSSSVDFRKAPIVSSRTPDSTSYASSTHLLFRALKVIDQSYCNCLVV